ncbi:MAG: D-alanyl-D-alanine endopeptidase [Sulfuriferula sp.]|jgi:serine-type D-Ala-D-Ala endopeptidase (penicillin-binding protein 7)|nr:D-alanyl-D-alanine endopeptidase [Sulfuriferula sp.]
MNIPSRYTLLLAAFAIIVATDADAAHSRHHAAQLAEYSMPDSAELPHLSALSVLVLNQDDDLPLYQKNTDMETPIASISKLMTAMVVLDSHPDMDEVLEITQADVDTLRHSSSRLAVGTRLSRGELLHLALIASENRAASALARNYPGGMEKFIAAMNRKTRSLGMLHTRFEDPTGLSSNNQSTATDLAKMVQAAIRYPTIHEITTTGSYEITSTGMVKVRHKHKQSWRSVTRKVAFRNTNELVRDDNWDIGLSKTGFINEAGHCLVMQATIAQKPVIIVLLDAYGKYGRISDAKRIKEWLEQRSVNNKVALRQDRISRN